uniref:RING-type domain-containing protein n=1 Tax=Oryza meridionalis TaxID=40149 RepID=A0A0E0CIK2_9ORYZ
MATTTSLLSSCLCALLLAPLFSQGVDAWKSRKGASKECRFDRLQAFEPLRKVRSEAGVTEYFDERNEQFQCAGVIVIRRVIEPQGLVVPRYSNTHALAYIIQGKGYIGLTFPGCPAIHQQQFQQFEQRQSDQGHKFRDEHQKIHEFRQGDVVALPVSVPHWFYNGGDTPAVVVYVYDIKSFANQLEPRHKEFLLAGNNQRGQQIFEHSIFQHSGQNIFSGFNTEVLSEALGINTEAAKRLQSQNDQRGDIIRVKHGLQLLKPTRTRRTTSISTRQYNGLDENICTIKARVNIENPNRADYYNPRARRITLLNNQKFPILNLIGMGAARVNLYQNALLSPFWNINAHIVVYIIQGSARVQVANNQGRTMFNGVIRQGQILIIPQNHAVIKKAEHNGCQYIAIKTIPDPTVSRAAGKNSILRALPVDVIANAYRISRDEARRLKNNRANEIGAFTPRFPKKNQRSYQFLSEGLSLIGMLVACAFVAMAAALLAIGWRVVAPRRSVGRAGAGASTPECGLTAAAIDALPASEYERPLGVGGDDGGDPACSVCLEDVRGGETVRRLPACGHLYHAACIDAWLRSRTTCPLCRCDLFERLQAFEPLQNVRSEAGVTEYFDEMNELFQCTGRGSMGLTFPGCPATYQQQSQQFLFQGESQSQKFIDEHQKMHQFRQSDIVALPTGVAHWFYNDGDTPVVALYVYDTKNSANQLEPRHREFLLAGKNNRVQQVHGHSIQQHSGQNIFNGFSVELLSEALNSNTVTTKRLQSQNDQRGEIIHVKKGLQLLKPTLTQRQEQEQAQYQENLCTIKTRLNIENPSCADSYDPRAGRITSLDSQKFPILNIIQMSATRVNLYQNAILTPFWNVNAHSLMYVIQGRARVQVVSNLGKTVFDDVLRPEQLLIIPQNYVVLKKAQHEGCQYIAINTNANAFVSHLAGVDSVFCALPVDVVANAYRVSREEARRLKNNRGDEYGPFPPRLQQQIYPEFSNESKGETSDSRRGGVPLDHRCWQWSHRHCCPQSPYSLPPLLARVIPVPCSLHKSHLRRGRRGSGDVVAQRMVATSAPATRCICDQRMSLS